MELKQVGEKIRNRRKSLGITQSELAEAAGYARRSMISMIESGSVNLPMDKLVLIADYLKMPLSSFFDTSDRVHIEVIDEDDAHPFAGLNEDQIRRVKEYIELIRRAEEWRHQNGTEKDGD